jgi:outer membrane receptor protein involved in Fe transport
MVAGDQFVDWDGRYYNYAPRNYFQRPDERWAAGVLGHYPVSARTEVYTQLMYMNDRSTAQIAPAAVSGWNETLACGNPLFSAQQFEALCGAYGLGLDDRQINQVYRRNVEGGPRRDKLRYTSARGLFGWRGNFRDNWRFDLYGQYARVKLKDKLDNNLLVSRVLTALEVAVDPATGEPACVSAVDGTDPACVPWDIFQEGGVTAEAVAYLTSPLSADGDTEQWLISGYVEGDLRPYGLRSPFAETGLELVLGAEYRDEHLDYDPDAIYRSGDAGGLAPLVLSGGFDVTELFTELHVPLMENKPAAVALSIDLGYRYSDYSTGETTNTYKAAISWLPLADLRLRVSRQHAVRVANIAELYEPREEVNFDLAGGDPCAGPVPDRSLADCARSGVTGAQYGAIPEPPEDANPYRELLGGNPQLQPEDSDTHSIGVIVTPRFMPGFSASLDWYEIEIDHAIGARGAASTLFSCLDSGAPVFCKQVHRDPGRGDLWRPAGTGYVDSTNQNLGQLRTRGYDLSLDWALDLASGGTLSLTNLLSYVDEWQLQEAPDSRAVECKGKWGEACNTVIPEMRNYLRLTWASPWQLSISGLWRYIDKLQPLAGETGTIDAYDYFDLSMVWQAHERVRLHAGVNNVFDKAPPFVITSAAPNVNGNTFPGVYDALGQYWFAGISIRF